MYQQTMPPAPPTVSAPPPGSTPYTTQPQRGIRLAVLVLAVLLLVMLAASTVSGAVGKARNLAYPKPRLGQISFSNGSGSSNTTIRSGDTLTFSVAILAGNDLSYRWSFGDGRFGNGPHPTHTYNGYANRLGVSVQVTDPLGQTATSLSLSLSVLPPPPIASFVIDYGSSSCYYYYGCYIYFDASNSSPGAQGIQITYDWSWGDGTSDDSGYDWQPYHVYPDQSGSYTVTLTVTDEFDQSSTSSQQLTIG